MTKLIPVILSGGAGTRLWPLSTEKTPKQFLQIWDGKSLFEETLERVAGDTFLPPIVVCNQGQRFHVEKTLERTGLTLSALLLEPDRRDSAAAIAAVSAYVQKTFGGDTVLAILASDHRIADKDAFQADLLKAQALAEAGYLVTFGIQPTRAAIEYGYIQHGEAANADGFLVQSFHEKPTAPKAADFLKDPAFLWNSGMFIFQAKTFAHEAELHMGDIWQSASAAVDEAEQVKNVVLLNQDHFASARKISIDYALFEKSNKVAVIPVKFDWSDVGNWQSVHEILSGTADNVELGDVKTLECQNSYIFSNSLPVRVVGLSNVAVVACEDGVLITRLDMAPRVKDVI